VNVFLVRFFNYESDSVQDKKKLKEVVVSWKKRERKKDIG